MSDNTSNPENITPVSYTHLRAHETVLDLVCRLLLEKKKEYFSCRGTTVVTTRLYHYD